MSNPHVLSVAIKLNMHMTQLPIPQNIRGIWFAIKEAGFSDKCASTTRITANPKKQVAIKTLARSKADFF